MKPGKRAQRYERARPTSSASDAAERGADDLGCALAEMARDLRVVC